MLKVKVQSKACNQMCAMYKITDIIREVKILITESSSVSTPKNIYCKTSKTVPNKGNGNK